MKWKYVDDGVGDFEDYLDDYRGNLVWCSYFWRTLDIRNEWLRMAKERRI